MVLVCRLYSAALNCIGRRVSMVSKRALLAFFLLCLIAVAASSASESPGETRGGASLFYKLGCTLTLPSAAQLPSNRYECGRYSVGQALEQARSTASMLDVTVGGFRGNGGVGAGALEDCRTLTSLTIDYLEEAQGILGRSEDALDFAAAARVRSLMSAVVTNQQTCFDGLEESRSFPELRADLDRENRFYDVSLDLVASALICRPAPHSSNASERLSGYNPMQLHHVTLLCFLTRQCRTSEHCSGGFPNRRWTRRGGACKAVEVGEGGPRRHRKLQHHWGSHRFRPERH